MNYRAPILRWIPVRSFAVAAGMVLCVLVAATAEQHMRSSALMQEIKAVALEVAHSSEPTNERAVEMLVRGRLASVGFHSPKITVAVRLTEETVRINVRHQQMSVAVAARIRRLLPAKAPAADSLIALLARARTSRCTPITAC